MRRGRSRRPDRQVPTVPGLLGWRLSGYFLQCLNALADSYPTFSKLSITNIEPLVGGIFFFWRFQQILVRLLRIIEFIFQAI